jgi:hypothetical protein
MYRLIDDTISMSLLSRHPCKWAKLNMNEPQLSQSSTRFLFNATILVDCGLKGFSKSILNYGFQPPATQHRRRRGASIRAGQYPVKLHV